MIFVTGATGHVGSELVSKLLDHGEKVRGQQIVEAKRLDLSAHLLLSSVARTRQ